MKYYGNGGDGENRIQPCAKKIFMQERLVHSLLQLCVHSCSIVHVSCISRVAAQCT